MKIVIDGNNYIDLPEVARKLGIAESTLKVQVRAKEVPAPTKLKTYTFWKEKEIEAYLEAKKENKKT